MSQSRGAELLEPAPETRFRRALDFSSSMRELWRSRELIRTLGERDLRVRYKQAFLGAAWALLTPIALMVVFTVFLQRVADFDTGGVPYPVFAYVALIPWGFFATSVSLGGQSLVANNPLLNKVYCPREVFPLSSMFVAATDMVLSSLVLVLLFAITDYWPRITSIWIPLLFAVELAFTVGVTLLVSASLVYLRDLRQALPILLQLGLFATPVAYGMDVIPADLQVPYSILNPLAPVIDGYRRAVLFGQPPRWDLLGVAAVSALVLLVVGYVVFKRLETSFADVA